jgi:serine/threonine protein kinase
MIGQTISHYKIVEKLGEGGMGIVYKAHDFKLDRFVALKFLPHDLTAEHSEHARFLQEAKAASALNQTNVCVVYDIAEHEEKPFIVMEYIDGMTLRKKFAQAPLKMNEALEYAIQIGEALQEAHSKGIVHRDIKADNIMINSKNQIKVMDFGLAKLRGVTRITKEQSTLGTLGYMSPEQIQGQDVDGRSDIFSFGVVLYEMLTGHLPFRGEHEAAMMYSIVNEEPIPLEKFRQEVSSELNRIILRALEKDPEDRYQSAADMVSEMRRLKKDTSRVMRMADMPVMQSDRGKSAAATSSSWLSKSNILIGSGVFGIILITLIWFTFFYAQSKELNPNATIRTINVPFTQIGDISLSQDGNWIVFSAADKRGLWDIHLINTLGHESRQITSDSSILQPMFDISSDGNRIVFVRSKKFAGPQICLISSLGGSYKVLVKGGSYPRWSPDNKVIGFIESTGDAVQFRTIRPDGDDNILVFRDTLSSLEGNTSVGFAWSPDGKYVVWIRTFESKYHEIIIHDLTSAEERQITFDKKQINDIFWAQDGHIFYTTDKSGVMNVWMLSSTGGSPVQITKGGGPDMTMKLSRDGKKLIYLQQQESSNLWMVNLDGGYVPRLTDDGRKYGFANFSPDNKSIVFIADDPDLEKSENHLYLANLDGVITKQLTFDKSHCSMPLWSPDGQWIAYNRRLSDEKVDSNGVYLINVENPTTPRMLSTGWILGWFGSQSCIITKGLRSYAVSIHNGDSKPMYKDSTRVLAVTKGFSVIFSDYRASSRGFWEVKAQNKNILNEVLFSNSDQIQPRRLPLGGPLIKFSADQRFVYFPKGDGKIWKLSLDHGNQKLIVNCPGMAAWSYFDISPDESSIIYNDNVVNSKVVMIENLFK